MTTLIEQVERIVAEVYSGHVASAAKRGRNSAYPYVPVVKFPSERYGTATRNPSQGLAYATREEATARAAKMIEGYKVDLREGLLAPNKRALREFYGLPRDIVPPPPPRADLDCPCGYKVSGPEALAHRLWDEHLVTDPRHVDKSF